MCFKTIQWLSKSVTFAADVAKLLSKSHVYHFIYFLHIFCVNLQNNDNIFHFNIFISVLFVCNRQIYRCQGADQNWIMCMLFQIQSVIKNWEWTLVQNETTSLEPRSISMCYQSVCRLEKGHEHSNLVHTQCLRCIFFAKWMDSTSTPIVTSSWLLWYNLDHFDCSDWKH